MMQHLVNAWKPTVPQLKAMTVKELTPLLKNWKVHIDPNCFSRDAMLAKALKVIHNIEEYDPLGSAERLNEEWRARDAVFSSFINALLCSSASAPRTPSYNPWFQPLLSKIVTPQISTYTYDYVQSTY